jgi:hypothetical protein
MRPAARRGESANYTLNVRIEGSQAATGGGFAGGPDFWEVTRIDADDPLNMRTGPSAKAGIVAGRFLREPSGQP